MTRLAAFAVSLALCTSAAAQHAPLGAPCTRSTPAGRSGYISGTSSATTPKAAAAGFEVTRQFLDSHLRHQ